MLRVVRRCAGAAKPGVHSLLLQRLQLALRQLALPGQVEPGHPGPIRNVESAQVDAVLVVAQGADLQPDVVIHFVGRAVEAIVGITIGCHAYAWRVEDCSGQAITQG